jgi:hypothetical protein
MKTIMMYAQVTAACLALALLQLCTAFVIQPRLPMRTTPLYSMEPKHSRLAGNQREPTAEELAVMDEMITKLANAKPYDLPIAVQRAFRVISSPRFFVRIAELTDRSVDETEKEKLAALAANLVATLEAVVSTAEDKLQEYAKVVETVVKAAAEPESGEFLVPLLPERIEAMRAAINNLEAENLEGDGFLSTVDAWINKSHQDGMDLMVGILQKVLQMYAGRRIQAARSMQQGVVGPAGMLLDELLQTDAEVWEAAIRQGVKKGVSVADLTTEIQWNMEAIVLSLESGSLAQRVQAEYLQEMVKRVEAVHKTL